MLPTVAALLAQVMQEPSTSPIKTATPMESGGPMAYLSMCCGSLCVFLFFAFMIAAQWKILTKAGQPGWSMFIPIYDWIVRMRVIGRPWYWWILYAIPFYGTPYLVLRDLYVLVECFGKGIGFYIATLLFPYITIPILGFGSSMYSPPMHVMGTPPMGGPPRPMGGPPRPQGPPRPMGGPPRPQGPPRPSGPPRR